MRVPKLHPDEVDLDKRLIRGLLERQFPHWAGLPLTLAEPIGTDNVTLRLGPELGLRLPRKPGAANGIAIEQDVVPRLAPYLDVAVPSVVGRGRPDEGYPYRWSVQPWLVGGNPEPGRDTPALARQLGRFARQLRNIDTFGMRPVGPLHSYRMDPIAWRDADTRAAIASCDELEDVTLLPVWDRLRHVEDYPGEPVWSHCDLTPGNLLVTRTSELAAVIDWGGLALGDPALDCMVSWNLLTAATRDVFRTEVDVDDATWARGRAWAFSVAVVALAYYYRGDNRQINDYSRHAIRQVLADQH